MRYACYRVSALISLVNCLHVSLPVRFQVEPKLFVRTPSFRAFVPPVMFAVDVFTLEPRVRMIGQSERQILGDLLEQVCLAEYYRAVHTLEILF